MYMRLGFAVAVHVDPDVLLVDEVLAVGDEAFTHKCLDRFADLKRQQKTIVLVTHTLDLVTRLCDEALWLDHGRIRGQGDPKRVVDAYLLDVAAKEDAGAGAAAVQSSAAAFETTPQDMTKATEGRWGSREAEITRVEMRHANQAAGQVFQSGEPVDIVLAVQAAHELTDFVFGVAVYSADGVCCYGTNTHIEGKKPRRLAGTGEVVFRIDALDLTAGTYRLDVAVHRADGVPYDYHRLLYSFRVTSPVKDVGFFRPKHGWSFSGGVEIDAPAVSSEKS
jgi:ATPase subunit of ABC transporter with duplicated ATPase domains